MQTESTSRVKGNLPDDLPEDPGNRYLLQSMNEGTDGGYGKLAEGSNPSLNVESWSKPEFGAPTTIVSSQSSSHRYAMTTN